jgi:type IV secretion system protein VirB10
MTNEVSGAAGLERGLPSVNDKRPKNNNTLVMILFFSLVLAIGGGALYWTMKRVRASVQGAVATKPKEEQSSVRKKTFDATSTVPGLPAGEYPPPAPEVKVPAIGDGSAVPPPIGGASGPPKPPPIGVTAQPSGPPVRSGVSNAGMGGGGGSPASGAGGIGIGQSVSPYDLAFVVNGGAQPGGGDSTNAKNGNILSTKPSEVLAALKGANGNVSAGLGNALGQDAGKGAMTGMLTPTSTPSVRAGSIGDMSLMAAKGTMVDCVLTTRIVAMLPGMVKCRLTTHLYSANGKVVLAERGSEVVGEQTGSMKQGQIRLYVLWSRINTTHGVTVNIDSPGTDALGGSGVDGDIDNRWAQRVGGAVVLSLVQDVFAYEIATQQANSANPQSGSATAAYQNTTQTGQKMAEKVLESTVSIPPVLYKNQGERISIFVARDIDFSSVYELQPN